MSRAIQYIPNPTPRQARKVLPIAAERMTTCPECGDPWAFAGARGKPLGMIDVQLNHRRYNLRRVIFVAVTGRTLTADDILHRQCDHPWCMSPRRTQVVTRTEHYRAVAPSQRNASHRLATARANRARAKLSTETVLAIRACDLNDTRAAAQFGVSRKTVNDIRSLRTHAHINTSGQAANNPFAGLVRPLRRA